MNSLFERKELENHYRKEGRLPPGQALTRKFPVLHYGPVPRFDPGTWTFKVWGEVETAIDLSWVEFQQLPRTQVTMDLHCVTAWSKFDTQWQGVAVRTLVDNGIIRLLPAARYVLQHAEYGFTANLPLEVVLQENFLMATHFNGEPISPDHGYPLRGVVGAIPDRSDLKTPYLWKGAKWLRGLEFLSEDKMGFWERAGYHNEADIWKEQRFG
ncbi:MAG TPA: molybdopterin-dependent oxidoreductase [Levilinea sp.]|nr:molybdopterin-dependent oxidoreductase [Levilinea sp.]